MSHSQASRQTSDSNPSDDPASLHQFKDSTASTQLPRNSAQYASESNQNVAVEANDLSTIGVSKATSPADAPCKPSHIPLAGQTLAAQVAMLKSQTPGSSSPIFIKTSKSVDEGTYVAITIPPHSTGQRNVIPLAIHQLKLKTADVVHLSDASSSELKSVTVNALPKTSSNVSGPSVVIQRVGGYPSSEEPGYGMSSSSQQSSQGIPSNFPYNDSAGLYSQSPVGGYMDGPHGAHHPPAGAQIYPSYPSQVAGVVGVGISPQAIGVAQQAQYLQPGQASSQRVPISHTTRASPITVQWLLENYETADGVSLPRSTLYNHYLRHCADSKIDAVNAASFGKLIRSVFLGLKTRRLGTRGNSKYHYYGIRVKPNSPLARLTDDTQVALRAQPSSAKRSASGSSFGGSRPSSGHSEPGSGSDGHDSAPHSSHRQYLGNAADGLSDLPVLDLTDFIPDGISKQEFANFGTLYRHHCEALLEVVSNLQFDLVESLWQAFWKSPAAVNKGESGTFESSDVPFETPRLVAVCRCKPVQKFVKETDYILYQKIVDILIPNVLRAIPSSLTQGIRNFAKSLENILIGSMSEMPKEIVNVKVAAVSAFSQTLRRYTSLNHLAQAARAVLQNPQQINQMWTDLNKVDFTNVQEQSSWVCQCDEALIQKLEHDFKQTLGQQQSLEQWAQWLENVVGLVLGDHEGQETYPKAARQFLLNWSFYSSMIIRDLTLRSAASFGSFHLIRLLYDEYMFYLIEHKVAAFSGKSPLAVMGECMGLSSFSSGDSFNGSANGDEDDNDEDSPDDEDDEGSLLTVPPLTQTILMAVGQHDPMLGSRSSDELLNVGARVTADQVMSQAFSEPEMKRMKTEYLA